MEGNNKLFDGDVARKRIVFDSNVEVQSLKDVVWKLTARVYLLEDFISTKFGEELGNSGYSKRKDSAKPPDLCDINEISPQPDNRRQSKRLKSNVGAPLKGPNAIKNKNKHKSNRSSSSEEESEAHSAEEGVHLLKETDSVIDYDFTPSHDNEDYNDDDVDFKNVLVGEVDVDKISEEKMQSFGQSSSNRSNTSTYATRNSKCRKCKEPSKSDADYVPNKRVKTSETSESENEDTVAETPKRKYRYLWVESGQFDTIEDAKIHIKSQKTWKFRIRYTNKNKDFTKILYDCKYSRGCDAKLKVEWKSYHKKVKLYKTTDNHTHIKTHTSGISPEVKNEIEKLIERGVTKPKDIMEEFPIDFSKPSKQQLTNYLSYRRIQLQRANVVQLPNDFNEELNTLLDNHSTENVSLPSEK